MEFVWAFNMKVYIQSYKDLGYPSQLDDWNVRVSNDGEIRLDNSHTKTTTTFLIDDSILFAEVSPWNIEISEILQLKQSPSSITSPHLVITP